MKKILIAFAMVAALSGCKTTPPDISNVKMDNLYTVGWWVTYSEVCEFFQGGGADTHKMDFIVKRYKGISTFDRGYERHRSLFGYDGVSNLTNCPMAKAVVDKKYEELK